jgi:hypothetical protein
LDFYPTEITTESTLFAVRRANLHGRLYLHPGCGALRKALRRLRRAGLAERVRTRGGMLGGWFARPREGE